MSVTINGEMDFSAVIVESQQDGYRVLGYSAESKSPTVGETPAIRFDSVTLGVSGRLRIFADEKEQNG